MPGFHPIRSWFIHHLLEIDEFSIHSPFVYDLYINVLRKAQKGSLPGPVEEIRKRSLKNNTRVTTGIIGASAGKGRPRMEKISRIARRGISPVKYSCLYNEIIQYFHFSTAVELGTSIGINTLCLGHKRQGCTVYTFEGNPALCEEARNNFLQVPGQNIQLIEGNIDSTLPAFAAGNTRPDFVLLDANHQYGPTLKYFNILKCIRAETSVFVIDDIHWSAGMEKAWNEIRKDPDVRADLDLWQAGVIIFRDNLSKISFRLEF